MTRVTSGTWVEPFMVAFGLGPPGSRLSSRGMQKAPRTYGMGEPQNGRSHKVEGAWVADSRNAVSAMARNTHIMLSHLGGKKKFSIL